MKETLERLQQITEGCREDMHEPDEQGLSAEVHGNQLDNAFPAASVSHEFRVKLTRGHENEFDTEYFNLATLIALARKADIADANLVESTINSLELIRDYAIGDNRFIEDIADNALLKLRGS